MDEQTTGGPVAANLPKLKSVSDLFKNAWEQYTKHFNALVPIMLVAGIGMYLQSIFTFFAVDDMAYKAGVGSQGSYAVQSGNMGMFAILALIAAVVYIIGMIWGYPALLNRIRKIDEPMSLGQAFTNAKPYIWPFFLTAILVGIFTIIGLILLIIPGIIVGVWLSFALFIVIFENKRGMEAIKASREYVKGYWWPVFGRLFLFGLVYAVVVGIIGSIVSAIIDYKLGMLVQNILSLILIPLLVLYQYDVYKNIRSIKGGAAI